MIDKEKVAQQAKKIMDSFMAALSNADNQEPEFKVKREANIRDAKADLKTNPGFRDRMLKNAPQVKDDCILAEKKKW